MFKLKYHYNNYLIKKYEKRIKSSEHAKFQKEFYEIALKESKEPNDILRAQHLYLGFLRGEINEQINR